MCVDFAGCSRREEEKTHIVNELMSEWDEWCIDTELFSVLCSICLTSQWYVLKMKQTLAKRVIKEWREKRRKKNERNSTCNVYWWQHNKNNVI